MRLDLIYGTLLGDAWIYKSKAGAYIFAFSQANKDYAIWKADKLELPYKVYYRKRYDKRTEKFYESWQVNIRLELGIRKELYSLFYAPKKIVNELILKRLTPEAIALWFMDDGNMYYNGNNCHIQLAVNGFTKQERLLIIEWFKEEYRLNFKECAKSIRITSKTDCETFMGVVEQYMPECMSYKILSNNINKYKAKRALLPKREWVSKAILQLDLADNIVRRWNSVKEASQELHLSSTSIYLAIRALANNEKYYTYNKQKWKYE